VRSSGGTSIQVDADRVTLRQLRLTSLPVVFESHTIGADHVGPRFARILGVETAGAVAGRAGLKFSLARRAHTRP
jgi:hypothetical protein